MKISVKGQTGQFQGMQAHVWSGPAIFLAVCWITEALLLSPFLGIPWLTTGDFKYSTAMYYHGIMIPVLVLFYLLTRKILPLNLLNKKYFTIGSIVSIFCAGFGSILNIHKTFSIATLVQILGMVTADLLGVAVLIAMMVFRSKERARVAEIHAGFWLLFFSVLAILVAAPFGHLAGWLNDLGAHSFPGLGAWIRTTGMKATDFQDGLISSHSHLIVAAFWCALSALTAIYFQYPFRPKWKKCTGTLGLWIALISLLLATIIYLLSATLGWESPAFFGSGPNGVPLDDLVLTIGGVGLLLVLVGLSGVPTGDKSRPFTFLQKNIRLAIFLAWISSFVGAVVMGIYIEFHENFYGAGVAPAPGAINDNIFIRAHLLFPFFLLPIIFTVLLAVGCRHNQINTPGPWPFAFVWTSIVGMALGLIGEIMWFLTLEKTTFLAGIIIMGTALIAGVRATFLTDYRH